MARGRLVVLGASAGGPAALASVLSSLPRDFNAAVVIVQHVDPQFSAGLASWLNHHSALPVRLAEEGDRPQIGEVLVAAREEHLVFTSSTRLGYTRVPVELSYRPSVDVFLKSVDHFWKGDVAAVLLTGMGRDGAEGLHVLRASGHHTIAQDRATSAVFGMPKAAADLKAAVMAVQMEFLRVVSLDKNLVAMLVCQSAEHLVARKAVWRAARKVGKLAVWKVELKVGLLDIVMVELSGILRVAWWVCKKAVCSAEMLAAEMVVESVEWLAVVKVARLGEMWAVLMVPKLDLLKVRLLVAVKAVYSAHR